MEESQDAKQDFVSAWQAWKTVACTLKYSVSVEDAELGKMHQFTLTMHTKY
jgi:hypothetical protein